MSTTKNLWGDLPLAEAVRTPIVILREQANQLTELTNGLLEGSVTSSKVQGLKPFFIRLSIIAPALEGYKYSVLYVYHDIMLYPLEVSDQVNGEEYECENEQQFMQVIEQILSSPGVHKSIAALLSQSRAEE